MSVKDYEEFLRHRVEERLVTEERTRKTFEIEYVDYTEEELKNMTEDWDPSLTPFGITYPEPISKEGLERMFTAYAFYDKFIMPKTSSSYKIVFYDVELKEITVYLYDYDVEISMLCTKQEDCLSQNGRYAFESFMRAHKRRIEAAIDNSRPKDEIERPARFARAHRAGTMRRLGFKDYDVVSTMDYGTRQSIEYISVCRDDELYYFTIKTSMSEQEIEMFYNTDGTAKEKNDFPPSLRLEHLAYSFYKDYSSNCFALTVPPCNGLKAIEIETMNPKRIFHLTCPTNETCLTQKGRAAFNSLVEALIATAFEADFSVPKNRLHLQHTMSERGFIDTNIIFVESTPTSKEYMISTFFQLEPFEIYCSVPRTPAQFRDYCVAIIKKEGGTNILTPHGEDPSQIDILYTQGSSKFGVFCFLDRQQCIGQNEMQEMIKILCFYGCDGGMIMTNDRYVISEEASLLSQKNNLKINILD